MTLRVACTENNPDPPVCPIWNGKRSLGPSTTSLSWHDPKKAVVVVVVVVFLVVRVGGVTRVGRLVRVRFGLVLVFLVLRVRVVVTRGSLVGFARVVRTGVVDGGIVREGSVKLPVVRGPRVVFRDVRTDSVVVVLFGRRVGADTRAGRFVLVALVRVTRVTDVSVNGLRVGPCFLVRVKLVGTVLAVRVENFGVLRSGVVRRGVRRGASTRVWSECHFVGLVFFVSLVTGEPLVGLAVLIRGRVGATLVMRVGRLTGLVTRVLLGFAVRAGGLRVLRIASDAVVVSFVSFVLVDRRGAVTRVILVSLLGRAGRVGL